MNPNHSERISNQRILVTGGTGFVGSHLVRRLVSLKGQVHVLARQSSDLSRIVDVRDQITFHAADIQNGGAVSTAMEQIRPRWVFHLAAEGVHDPYVSPTKALKTNLDGTLNVLQAAANAGAERIIHTGSSYEYGEKAGQKQIEPISHYAAAKAAAWSFCQMYYRAHGWPITTLRLFQVYGPGQAGTLIPSAIQAAAAGRPFPTTGGEQIRDWVYVDDVIEAYLLAATAPQLEGQTLDIGTGIGTSVRQIVEAIFAHFPGTQPNIGALPYRPGEVWSLIADPAGAQAALGWQPQTSLEAGLKQTIAADLAATSAHEPAPAFTNPANGRADLDALRAKILDEVSEYWGAAHQQRDWQPGISRVQYAGRVFDDQEMRNMADSMLEFWLTAGRYAEAFETKLAAYLNVREVIPVNSGSSANLVAMTTLCSRQMRHAEPLKPGDEVITTAVAFPTTIAPIIQNGLVPVLVDSEMGTYNIDVTQLEAALSPRTRALFITHTLGNPAEMDTIMAFAREHNLFVIEDNCDALGSQYDGRMTGTFGDLATSSFYPAHHITMGEGGAVYTNNPRLAKIARTVRDWGRDCWCGYTNLPDGQCGKRFDWKIEDSEARYDHRYLFTEIGYNLKLTDPQAAVGVAQMDKLPHFVSARKHNFRQLYEGLKPLEQYFILPTWGQKADPSWFAFPITLRPDTPFDRTALQRYLESHRIETRLLFAGNILKQPGYRHIHHRVIGDLPVANEVMQRTLFIGVYPGLGNPQLEYAINTFHAFIRQPSLETR